MDINHLNEVYIDIFKEIANIGSGHATTALATLMQNVLHMDVPNVRLVKISDIAKLLGDEEALTVGVFHEVEGEISATMMHIMPIASAKRIIEILLHKEVNDVYNLESMELSVLNEIGNILTGSYLSAFADLTKLNISQSTPYLSIDMAGAILSVPATQYGIMSDEVLLVETEFKNDTDKIVGYYLLIPDEESLAKILKSLWVEM